MQDQSQTTRAIVFAAFVVVFAGALIVPAVLWGVAEGSDAGSVQSSVTDSEIASLVAFVQDERELEFEDAVPVVFLADDEFEAALAETQGDVDSAEFENAAAQLRALGLIEGDIDLQAAIDELLAAEVLGFYDTESRSITVRGEELSPAVRTTLVHELTHALQDQHFELDLIDNDTDAETDDERAGALRAVVEGDATRVQNAYTAGLSAAELQSVVSEEGTHAQAAAGLDVPDVLQAWLVVPYTFGPAFVEGLVQTAGIEAVDQAIADPPASEQEILFPDLYREDREPADVATPAMPGGATEIASGDFGVVTLIMMLAERLDPQAAMAVAESWDGDAFVLYKRSDGVSCVNLAVAGESAQATQMIRDVFSAWVELMPPGSAGVAENPEFAAVTSCDPGTAASGYTTGDGADTLMRLGLRDAFLAQLEAAGLPSNLAACLTDRFLAGFSTEELLAFSIQDLTPELQAQIEQWAIECAAPA